MTDPVIAEILGIPNAYRNHRDDTPRALPWMQDALCAQMGDPELFFPSKGGSTREAKAICRMCTVQAECLTLALTTGEGFGIWGGASERERRKLSRGDAA